MFSSDGKHAENHLVEFVIPYYLQLVWIGGFSSNAFIL